MVKINAIGHLGDFQGRQTEENPCVLAVVLVVSKAANLEKIPMFLP